MTAIHATAIVHPKAQIDPTATVGPYSVVEEDVAIGPRTVVGPHCLIARGTRLGAENRIHFGAVLGHEPQDLAYDGGSTATIIGDRNTIREYVTIHRGTTPGSSTVIGSDNFLMANVHVAHNCRVGNHVIMANLATLAGHCVVEDQATLAGLTVCHQFTRIGRLAMLSGLSGPSKDVPPFLICTDRRGVIRGVNVVGLRRAGIGPAARTAIKRAYQVLYRSGLNTRHALEQLRAGDQTPEVQQMIAFVETAKRGICPGATARIETSEDDADETT